MATQPPGTVAPFCLMPLLIDPKCSNGLRPLQAAHIEFFQDFLSIEPGERWERQLYKEIDVCDLFLLFWSSSAVQSQWVLREAELAVARQNASPDEEPDITPIILEGPPVPQPIPAIARGLRQRRPRPGDRWHLDEMVVRIAGRRMYLWRTVDQDGEILDLLIQPRRDKRAGKLLRKHGFAPKLAVKTSCAPVPPHSGLEGCGPTNRAENSYQAVGKCPGAKLMPRVRR